MELKFSAFVVAEEKVLWKQVLDFFCLHVEMAVFWLPTVSTQSLTQFLLFVE